MTSIAKWICLAALSVSACLATAQKPVAKRAVVEAPFDLTQESVPIAYRGHDLLAVIESFQMPPKKSEFETTDEHESRLANWRTRPFLGQLTPASKLAFVPQSVRPSASIESEYDADKEMLTVRLLSETKQAFSSQFYWVEYFYSLKRLGERKGVTVGGVRFQYSALRENSVGIEVSDRNLPIELSFHVARPAAQAAKANATVLLIVDVVAPYKIEDSGRTTPSLTNPLDLDYLRLGLVTSLVEVWVFDRTTGAVHQKLRGDQLRR